MIGHPLDAPPLSREDAYNRLRAAYLQKQVNIVLDIKELNRPSSLVYNALDIYVPALVLLTSSITLLFAFGMTEWIIALVAVLLFQLFGAPILVEFRLKRRTFEALLNSLASFSLIWTQGGVALILAEYPENFCVAPKGDWQAFVTIYLTQELSERPLMAPPPLN